MYVIIYPIYKQYYESKEGPLLLQTIEKLMFRQLRGRHSMVKVRNQHFFNQISKIRVTYQTLIVLTLKYTYFYLYCLSLGFFLVYVEKRRSTDIQFVGHAAERPNIDSVIIGKLGEDLRSCIV